MRAIQGCATSSTSSAAVFSRAAIPNCFGRSSTACSTMTPTCCWPTFNRISIARPRSRRPTATANGGRECRSSTPRAAVNFRPIAPFASIAKKSGTSNPCRFTCSHTRKQETHSAPQRLGRAPQQLIAHGEGGQELAAHGQLAQPSYRYVQTAAHRGRRQSRDRGFLFVGNDAHPGVAAGNERLDFRERQVPRELDGERLRMAAHRADPDAYAFNGNRVRLEAEDLIGFDARLPFLAALAVAQILIDPRYEAARKRHIEVRPRKIFGRKSGTHRAIDFQYAGSGIS